MQHLHLTIHHPVRLMKDLPELGLHAGDAGVICSAWGDPTTAYEVEFQPSGLAHVTRALLLESQIESAAPHPHPTGAAPNP
jgi:hypothetical protein